MKENNITGHQTTEMSNTLNAQDTSAGCVHLKQQHKHQQTTNKDKGRDKDLNRQQLEQQDAGENH